MNEQEVDLSSYLKDNKDIIELTSVFVGIAAAAAELLKDVKTIRYVACIFIILVLLLLLELYKNFPKRRKPTTEMFFWFYCLGVAAITAAVLITNLDFILFILGGMFLGLVLGLVRYGPGALIHMFKK